MLTVAHGKEPIDGIGGETKRSVWRATLKGNVVVNSAIDFYTTAKQLSKDINVLFVGAEDIKSRTAHLDIRWEKAKAVGHIARFHHFKPIGEVSVGVQVNNYDGKMTTIYLGEVANAGRPTPEETEEHDETNEECTSANEPLAVQTGDTVAVAYEEDMYVGEVCELGDGSSKIEFFVPAKNAKDSFRRGGDTEWVEEPFILSKINSADIIPLNNGRLFRIENFNVIKAQYERYQKQYF